MDAYQVLGLARGASEEEVKAAYRALAQKYNPENYEAGPLREDAERKMEQINEAFDTVMSELRTGASSNNAQNPYGGQNPGQQQNGGPQGATGSYPEIRALIRAGRADEALAQLQSIPNGPANAEWNFLKGVVCYRRGWMDEALRYYRTAVQMDPGNAEYRQALDYMEGTDDTAYRPGGSFGTLCSNNPCATLCCLSLLCNSGGYYWFCC